MFTQPFTFMVASGPPPPPPPPPAPMAIFFSTSFYYTPTENGDQPLSTDYYYNLNIT